MAQLAFGHINSKVCIASLVIPLSVFFTGCANSCFSGFWNPPNGTIGTVISNPPPTCKLATPKGAIRVVVQVSGSCESCSGSNRVHSIVLNLSGIDVHSSANAVDELSGWQALVPEPGKQPNQVEFLTEKMNLLFSESTEMAIPAGSYDLVRLRLSHDHADVDDGSLLPNACGEGELNCVIMADGQIAHLVFEPDALKIRLTSEATGGRLLIILPGSDNELFISLTPVLSVARRLAEATPSFVLLPGTTHLEPMEREEARQYR